MKSDSGPFKCLCSCRMDSKFVDYWSFCPKFTRKMPRSFLGLMCISLSIEIRRRHNTTPRGITGSHTNRFQLLFFALDSLADGYHGLVRDKVGYQLRLKLTHFKVRTIRTSLTGRYTFPLPTLWQRTEGKIWPCHVVHLLVRVAVMPRFYSVSFASCVWWEIYSRH